MEDQEYIASMVADLVALDSTLAGKEVELASMIALLRRAAPNAVPRAEFIKNVRDMLEKRLLASAAPERGIAAVPRGTTYFALFRVAPVLIVVFLVLFFADGIPQQKDGMGGADLPNSPITSRAYVTPKPLSSPESRSGESMIRQNLPFSPETSSLGISSESVNDDGVALDVGLQEPGATISVASLSLRYPGFIVVYDSTSMGIGEMRGVSELLPPGMLYRVPVAINPPATRGEVLTVRAVIDDGDGFFSPEDASVASTQGDFIEEQVTIGNEDMFPSAYDSI